MKKFTSLILLFVITFCGIFVSCKDKSAKVSLWTIDATQKILQDYEYDTSAMSTSVSVSGAKNEYEGWQIILSSIGNVSSSYTITTNNLIAEDGSVYSKNNISLFHQLYLEVSPNEYYVEDGYYPDPILPMETAIEYNENIIQAGKNQGIYVEFYIPLEQKTGVYTGSFKVKTAENEFIVPIKLQVWDYSVSEKTTAKSLFLTRTDYWNGEKDTTQEKYQAYIDTLLEYRLSANDLLLETNHNDACIEEFTELAYEYASNERCSTISLPFKVVYTSQKYVYNGEELSLGMIFDEEVCRKYIRALAKKSAETGVNILEKCVSYFTIIDEPQLNKTMHRVKYVSERFAVIKEEMYSEILSNTSLVEDKISRQELANSVKKISNIVTGYYDKDLDGVPIDYCPNPSEYHTQGMRDVFSDNEKWWYCCIYPNNPYPTYHIDDHLLGTRLLYWMAAEYNVVGNLNWSVSMYNVGGEQPEDYYKYAMHNWGRNGEGFLFYPGAKYNLDGPVASLRLQAYRDGIEEYEMMQALKTKYAEYGLDFQSILSYLGSSLYSGTRWATTENTFYNTRENLATICEMALSSSDEAMMLSDMINEGRNFKCKVFALNNTSVKINGEDINNLSFVTKQQVANGTIYEVKIDKATFSSRTLTFSTSIKGQTKSIVVDLGGELTLYNASDFENAFEIYNDSKITFEKVTAESTGYYDAGNLIKFTLSEDEFSDKYSVSMTAGFLSELSKNCKEMQLVFYVDTQVDYEISFLYEKGSTVAGRPIFNLISAGRLNSGENTVKISNLDSYNWTKYQGVSKVLLSFKAPDGTSIYLKEIILSGG